MSEEEAEEEERRRQKRGARGGWKATLEKSENAHFAPRSAALSAKAAACADARERLKSIIGGTRACGW
jgi:hypothetical protein